MNVAAFIDGACDSLRVYFRVLSAQQQHFCAVGEKFRGATFGDLNVRQFMAKDAMIGLAK
jgi:hypothetical protein